MDNFMSAAENPIPWRGLDKPDMHLAVFQNRVLRRVEPQMLFLDHDAGLRDVMGWLVKSRRRTTAQVRLECALFHLLT